MAVGSDPATKLPVCAATMNTVQPERPGSWDGGVRVPVPGESVNTVPLIMPVVPLVTSAQLWVATPTPALPTVSTRFVASTVNIYAPAAASNPERPAMCHTLLPSEVIVTAEVNGTAAPSCVSCKSAVVNEVATIALDKVTSRLSTGVVVVLGVTAEMEVTIGGAWADNTYRKASGKLSGVYTVLTRR